MGCEGLLEFFRKFCIVHQNWQHLEMGHSHAIEGTNLQFIHDLRAIYRFREPRLFRRLPSLLLIPSQTILIRVVQISSWKIHGGDTWYLAEPTKLWDALYFILSRPFYRIVYLFVCCIIPVSQHSVPSPPSLTSFTDFTAHLVLCNSCLYNNHLSFTFIYVTDTRDPFNCEINYVWICVNDHSLSS